MCVYYPRDQNKLEAVEAEAKQLREAAKEHAEKLEATGGETESLRDQVFALVDRIIPYVLNHILPVICHLSTSNSVSCLLAFQ